MADSANSILIVEQARVNGLPLTYVLGSYAARVTFCSQQIRAFNLIWALFEQKIISEGSKVCIVGGGLAGMTAAAAAKLKRCNVTIYESGDQLMSLQRRNPTRYVHPNICDWPKNGSEINKTKLPCLNWSAAKTEEVVEQIDQEWELVKEGIDVQVRRNVRKIKENDGKPRVTINDPFITEQFDCVILATGFGIEQSFGDVPLRAYWDNDNLHQTMKWAKLPKKILVTGCGDGGLIDVLRLKLVDFKHAKFTVEFLENASLKDLREKLIKIEENAPADPEKTAIYFIDQYKDLPIDETLMSNIKSKIRSDTKVTLNSSLSTPLNSVASILNRFAIYLLIKLEELKYISSKVTSVTRTAGGFDVVFSENEPEVFDDVIVRHGPVPIIQDLIPSTHVPIKSKKEDLLAGQLWPDDFYAQKIEDGLKQVLLSSPPYGEVISIMGSNGRFVSSEGGGGPMYCNRQYSGSYERFLVVDAGKGKFALENYGRYVTSQNGSSPIVCDRPILNVWEKFEWVCGPEGIGFKGNNSCFISSRNGEAMTCDIPVMKSCEWIFRSR